MSYLEKNLNCIKKNRKRLYDQLTKIIDKREYDFSKFKIIDTKNGQKTIEIINDGKNVRLNSIYNPQAEAEKWASSFEFNNLDTPLLMFGIANGIFVREIVKYLKQGSFAILVEPDISLFIYCIQQFDMTDIFSDSKILLVIDKINFDKFAYILNENIDSKLLNIQIVCSHPKMEKLYPEKCKEFTKRIMERFAKSTSELLTSMFLSEAIIDNLFKNFRFLKNSNYVMDMVGKIPQDIPFIIVAAGPSLDKNVDYLKKAEGKSFIMATDRAVDCLIKHNIDFDAIITLDAVKTIKFLGDDPEKFSKFPIFAGIDSNNGILKENKGRKIWITTSDFWLELCHKHDLRIKLYSIGGSVATAAFNVARIVGSKKIILIGQDLAFDGSLTHAGGISESTETSSYNEFPTTIEGIYGNQVKTRSDWVKFRNWYEKSIQEMEKDIEVIDATEGGAKIHGTTIMTLEEAIGNYCKKEFKFKQIVNNMKPTFCNKMYLDLKNDLINLKEELGIIKKCAEKGIKASDSLFDMCVSMKRDFVKEKEYCETIKEMNKTIEEQLIYKVIGQYIEKYTTMVMRNVNIITDDEEENYKDSCRISKFMYKQIIEAVKIITPKLEEGLKEL